MTEDQQRHITIEKCFCLLRHLIFLSPFIFFLSPFLLHLLREMKRSTVLLSLRWCLLLQTIEAITSVEGETNIKLHHPATKTMRSNTPALNYFKLQGLGEPVRLTLALAGQEWNELPDGIDYASLKANAGSAEWPFGQAPRYSDNQVQNITSSMSIIRYLGRKHKLYGDSIVDETHIDMILDSFMDFNVKYVKLIYVDKCEETALDQYIKMHLTPGQESGRNGGVHYGYLENWLQRNGGQFAVGSRLSIGDIVMYYNTSRVIDRDLFKQKMDFRKSFPLLSKHYDMVKGNPNIKSHLESDKHFPQMNGNRFG